MKGYEEFEWYFVEIYCFLAATLTQKVTGLLTQIFSKKHLNPVMLVFIR